MNHCFTAGSIFSCTFDARIARSKYWRQWPRTLPRHKAGRSSRKDPRGGRRDWPVLRRRLPRTMPSCGRVPVSISISSSQNTRRCAPAFCGCGSMLVRSISRGSRTSFGSTRPSTRPSPRRSVTFTPRSSSHATSSSGCSGTTCAVRSAPSSRQHLILELKLI